MIGLDLRIQPPRAPREQLDGLVFMPRTIDKVRATLPGGHLGPYHITPGMSQLLLSIIGVELARLRTAVMTANTDDDVAQWLRVHADASQYERANAALTQFRHENIAPEHMGHFESLYPEFLRRRYALAIDLLEADDRELYPALDNG
ncbi:MAG TPA: DUF5069 domain-containing protein [Candidatus Baltobacteraceae bacterium]